ncbi:hypothetical protein AAFF_G00007870 [Aldrovandia affinis]|uniref:Beta/gamma crystallin 'Greek key' domain-containing protein n=1 Tax=Aldrovandia affinis TaxID=143900 RepID=A0AAD7T631_9TELE|nr:hypothetical protein AAFF_G00007870 [Aldrovandia affinis]
MKVEIIFYEDRDFQGRFYECSRDCADLHSYFSLCNSVRVESGCSVLYERPNYMGLGLYERPDFGSQIAEHIEDCPLAQETFWLREVHSSVVMDGAWMFYEQPNYRGRQYFLDRGEYRKHMDWGTTTPVVHSFHRITKF